jgi:hypothetical protein
LTCLGGLEKHHRMTRISAVIFNIYGVEISLGMLIGLVYTNGLLLLWLAVVLWEISCNIINYIKNKLWTKR